MSSEDKEQVKFHVRRGLRDKFQETVAKKWGIHKYGLLSYEQERLMEFYISVGGVLPNTAHTHKNRIESNIVPSRHNKSVKELESENNGLVVPVNSSQSTGSGSGFGFNSIPESSPLMQFIMKKTGGNWKFEERHYALAERLRTDPEFRKQWHEDTIKRLRAKARRIDYLNYQKKLQEQDRDEIRPEIRLIKQDLVTTDSISDKDRVRRDQLHRAFVTVTGKTDKRTFDKRLILYEQHEYFSPVDPKGTAFRALQKFLEI